MKVGERLYFARDNDGKVVEVTQVERGLGCHCICLGCGGRLVAKQGTKVVWHFAHDQPTGSQSCGETALHLAAKAALRSTPSLWLPSDSWRLEGLQDMLGRGLPVNEIGRAHV